jgi:hypothetical protein
MFDDSQKDLHNLYNDPYKFVEKSENVIFWNFKAYFLLTKT